MSATDIRQQTCVNYKRANGKNTTVRNKFREADSRPGMSEEVSTRMVQRSRLQQRKQRTVSIEGIEEASEKTIVTGDQEVENMAERPIL